MLQKRERNRMISLGMNGMMRHHNYLFLFSRCIIKLIAEVAVKLMQQRGVFFSSLLALGNNKAVGVNKNNACFASVKIKRYRSGTAVFREESAGVIILQIGEI